MVLQLHFQHYRVLQKLGNIFTDVNRHMLTMLILILCRYTTTGETIF